MRPGFFMFITRPLEQQARASPADALVELCTGAARSLCARDKVN